MPRFRDVGCVIPLAEIGLRINCVHAHIPHHPAYFLSIDKNVVIAANKLRDHPIPVGRVPGMQFVDPSHDKQILIGNRSFFWGIPIHAGSVDFKKIRLSADGNGRLTKIDEISSSNRVRGFDQIFF